MTNDQTIEKKLQAKDLNAPRLTPAKVESVIEHEQYHVFENSTVTVCCLTLSNGTGVVGESACASPANFDEAIGREIARANAVARIWSLEGYLLRETLAVAESAL